MYMQHKVAVQVIDVKGVNYEKGNSCSSYLSDPSGAKSSLFLINI